MLSPLHQNLSVHYSETLLEHSYAYSNTDVHCIVDCISSLLIFLEKQDHIHIALNQLGFFFLIHNHNALHWYDLESWCFYSLT